jgi:hypothetical protein
VTAGAARPPLERVKGEVEMDLLRALADQSIRRASGFVELGVGMTMVALSFDPTLSLRVGGDMTALFCLALIGAAWHAPRRDVRRTELWALLAAADKRFTHELPLRRAQELLASVLRERMLRQADFVGLTALALWLAPLAGALFG